MAPPSAATGEAKRSTFLLTLHRRLKYRAPVNGATALYCCERALLWIGTGPRPSTAQRGSP